MLLLAKYFTFWMLITEGKHKEICIYKYLIFFVPACNIKALHPMTMSILLKTGNAGKCMSFPLHTVRR